MCIGSFGAQNLAFKAATELFDTKSGTGFIVQVTVTVGGVHPWVGSGLNNLTDSYIGTTGC